jgi:hypothetical protein
MNEKYPTVEEIDTDIQSMGAAVQAISAIPTVFRREVAMRWLTARVEADLVQLRRQERDEKIVTLVGAVFGENE